MLIVVAAVLGGLAVVCGAFGAHLLEGRLGADALKVYGTAVDYHFVHALGLLATGVLQLVVGRARALNVAAASFVIGIVLFSGSLYLLALTGNRWLGMVTPLGGVAFIFGWAALAWGGYAASRIMPGAGRRG